jgi:hypothetical protein
MARKLVNTRFSIKLVPLLITKISNIRVEMLIFEEINTETSKYPGKIFSNQSGRDMTESCSNLCQTTTKTLTPI